MKRYDGIGNQQHEMVVSAVPEYQERIMAIAGI